MDRRSTSIVLLSLAFLDVVISVVALLFPQLWFTVFHGTEYVDPQGLLRRCGANWAAFALFQLLAYLRYREHPHWLILVAGLRFSDIFTDWSYLYFSNDLTWFGWVALLLASPTNLCAGLFFMKRFGEANRPEFRPDS